MFRVSLKTIDELHKEHVEEFKKSRDSVPLKKNKLASLENELLELDESNKTNNLDIEYLKSRNKLKKVIQKLKEEIDDIENYTPELNYYSITGDVLYDYYDQTNGVLYNKDFNENKIDENKSDDNKSNENVIESTRDEKQNGGLVPKINISEELISITNMDRKRKIKKPVRKRNGKVELVQNKSIMSYLLGSDIEKKEIDDTSRAKLQNEYLIMMDKEYACSKIRTNICRKCKNPKCGGADKIIIYNESIMTCPKCGESEDIFIESDIPSHRETFNEKPKYPYKRIGHCIEKLNQFLCKGTANIPQEIFSTLNDEVTKHGLVKEEITKNFIEKMLKKHKMSDYYEYIMFLYSKMTNTQPQTITREEYELALKMFMQVDDVYEKKFKPKTRNNFLKYTFALNKIFLTMGKPDIAKHFKLLKSPVKMKEQERIWQQTCEELGWSYISS
jgi:hypothetical protein